jgi:cyclic pyranopterin phosphate synthase
MSVEEMLDVPGVKERIDVEAHRENGPGVQTAAAFYRPLRSGAGDVGFISPMSQRFCSGCNRLRLTADGRLRSCLPTDTEVSLRSALRSKSDDSALADLILKAVSLKPEYGEYKFSEQDRRSGCIAARRSMTEIGG